MTLYDRLKDEYRIKIDSNTEYLGLRNQIQKSFKRKTLFMHVNIEDLNALSWLLNEDINNFTPTYVLNLFRR